MPKIGFDCQIIIDGTGYFTDPGTYAMSRPRVRAAATTRGIATAHAGVPERYLDRGPAKREWSMIVLCYNTLKRYDGSQIGNVGQSLRNALHASYEKVGTTLSFTDPTNTTWSVHFDDLSEAVADLREQAGPPTTIAGAAGTDPSPGTLGYAAGIILIEA